ncbi:protein NATD1 [Ctenocephalides felis]|uniref:protein NATD1 n=1 Tax=Ctenocephalides felis TaxID=7515 RepID=UPI000E6E322D|nr:protein NATD1 [Ctenocephalides felis]
MLPIGSILSKLATRSLFSNTMITRSQVAAFSSDNIEIKHHKNDSEFSVTLGNDKAYLEYVEDDTTIDILHVFVPDVFRGKNVAKLLSQAALDYVANQDKKMIMTCTYFSHYVDTKAPEYKKFLHQ